MINYGKMVEPIWTYDYEYEPQASELRKSVYPIGAQFIQCVGIVI